jgi:hypothetical protein
MQFLSKIIVYLYSNDITGTNNVARYLASTNKNLALYGNNSASKTSVYFILNVTYFIKIINK